MRAGQITGRGRIELVDVNRGRPLADGEVIVALETGDIPISQVSIPQRSRLAAIKDEKFDLIFTGLFILCIKWGRTPAPARASSALPRPI